MPDESQRHQVDIGEQIQAMRLEMFAAAENLEFEKAARMRDELKRFQALAGTDGASAVAEAKYEPYGAKRKKSGASAKAVKVAGGGAKAAKRQSRKWKP